jgi:hypothetical protein
VGTRKRKPQTLAAVGCTQPSLTCFAVFPTVVVNHPKPLLNAATGSFWRSSKPGKVGSLFGCSTGWLPKPAYLPPWEGGRSSGRLAFAAPRPAKYLSSTLALEPGGREEGVEALGCRVEIGVWERGVCEREFVEDGGGLLPGMYSRPSTLAVRRSLYSSPTSPE